MKLKTTLRIAAATFGLMAAVLVPAIAGPFATFNQTGSNPNPWVFTNNGASSTFTVASGSIPVDFTYSISNGTGLVGVNIPATLTFSAGPSTTAFNFGGFDVQPLDLFNMTITSNASFGGLNNLLTLTGTGALSGFDGGTPAGFAGDSNLGDTVVYSSDFLNFSGQESYQYAYTLAGGSSVMGIAGNSYLKNFLASGTGNFFAGQARTGVPEPSTNAAFLLGGLGLLGLVAFGRKTRAGSLSS